MESEDLTQLLQYPPVPAVESDQRHAIHRASSSSQNQDPGRCKLDVKSKEQPAGDCVRRSGNLALCSSSGSARCSSPFNSSRSERIKDDIVVTATRVHLIDQRKARLGPEHHRLTVDRCGCRLQTRQGRTDARKSVGPVMSTAGEQAHPAAFQDHHEALTAVFGLMQPTGPDVGTRGGHWDARLTKHDGVGWIRGSTAMPRQSWNIIQLGQQASPIAARLFVASNSQWAISRGSFAFHLFRCRAAP